MIQSRDEAEAVLRRLIAVTRHTWSCIDTNDNLLQEIDVIEQDTRFGLEPLEEQQRLVDRRCLFEFLKDALAPAAGHRDSLASSVLTMSDEHIIYSLVDAIAHNKQLVKIEQPPETENSPSLSVHEDNIDENHQSMPPNCERYKNDSEKYEDVSIKYKSNSEKYEDGTRKYKSNSKKYEDGTRKYKSNSEKYKNNSEKYEDGTRKYKSNSEKYEDGSEKNKDGTRKYKNDSEKYEDGSRKREDSWDLHLNDSADGSSKNKGLSNNRSSKYKNNRKRNGKNSSSGNNQSVSFQRNSGNEPGTDLDQPGGDLRTDSKAQSNHQNENLEDRLSVGACNANESGEEWVDTPDQASAEHSGQISPQCTDNQTEAAQSGSRVPYAWQTIVKHGTEKSIPRQKKGFQKKERDGKKAVL